MADTQEKKDKTILDFFSGSNPNRQKVEKIIKERKNTRKKEKKRIRNLSDKLGFK